MITKILIGPHPQTKKKVDKLLSSYKLPPLTLDGSSQTIKISQVRNLQKQISLSTPNQIQPIVIHQAQNLTLTGQHALLKTLEEPPSNHQFLLTIPTTHSLLPTILSRGQLIYLNPTINNKVNKQSLQLLQNLASKTPAQLITFSQKLAKKNSTDLLHQTLNTLRIYLKRHPTTTRNQALKLIDQCLQDQNNNLNTQLAYEHLFLKLHQILIE